MEISFFFQIYAKNTLLHSPRIYRSTHNALLLVNDGCCSQNESSIFTTVRNKLCFGCVIISHRNRCNEHKYNYWHLQYMHTYIYIQNGLELVRTFRITQRLPLTEVDHFSLLSTGKIGSGAMKWNHLKIQSRRIYK